MKKSENSDLKAAYLQSIEDWKEFYDSRADDEFLDDDGYPTESALQLLERWHWADAKGWFEFAKSIWWSPDWGWHETEGGEDRWLNQELPPDAHRYHISTGGWSGNEAVIRAMQSNSFMWALNWVQSRRGGHYIFELKVIKE